jgi:2-amino-4-hydroxy-6-hydroxymethyldihydropteridine diphosphokinase
MIPPSLGRARTLGTGMGQGESALRLAVPAPDAHRVDVALALGASLGDRAGSLQLAMRALDAHPELTIVRCSRIYATPPVGGVAHQGFLNAVVRIRTPLAPLALLDLCQALERRLGRRRARSWADRVLDIDILLYGTTVIATERLRVPHARLAERDFFLTCLAEAWPEAPNPWTGLPWAARLRASRAYPVVSVFPLAPT